MPRRTQRYSKIGDTMKTIDLSGKWNYKTDIDDSQTIDSIKERQAEPKSGPACL